MKKNRLAKRRPSRGSKTKSLTRVLRGQDSNLRVKERANRREPDWKNNKTTDPFVAGEKRKGNRREEQKGKPQGLKAGVAKKSRENSLLFLHRRGVHPAQEEKG